MIVERIVAAIICLLALIVTFRTENVLKTVFRVENPDYKIIIRTKIITLCITVALFAVVLLVFK